ncbi:MAG: TIGR04283 family arsenosugar biosynthesis glycosyltransferase [Alphaproteobacteria bacterium]
MNAPLSIVIPTLNAADTLPVALEALVPGVVAGLVRDVVVADGGSSDGTLAIADHMGARIIKTTRGGGHLLREGAAAAQGDWLLFLHADTILEAGWARMVRDFMERAARAKALQAAAFTFALDDFSPSARRLERMVAWRCRILALPYGDQGLLISRAFYDGLGGFQDMPLMEDVDIVRRIGRRRLSVLPVRAVTSADRFRSDGYVLRSARNLSILGLYFLRVPPRLLARLYG